MLWLIHISSDTFFFVKPVATYGLFYFSFALSKACESEHVTQTGLKQCSSENSTLSLPCNELHCCLFVGRVSRKHCEVSVCLLLQWAIIFIFMHGTSCVHGHVRQEWLGMEVPTK